MSESLWGEVFSPIEAESNTSKILDKIKKSKSSKGKSTKEIDIYSKMNNIRDNVYRILGRYKDNTICIRNIDDFRRYIDKAIANGIIAIDTETNNSLDPITCKLMGPCIYTPGEKNAYIPINHVNVDTRELLPNQLTEEDVFNEFARLKDTLIIMHNGKFDYQVIKCTTGLELKVYWDTMLGARMLDENERHASLKQQYIDKIDPSIEKYSIEHLFEGLEYAIFEPELFALYAATDAYMTYKLYLWQKEQFEIKGNERLYNVFLTVEMPVMVVAAEMELTGVCIDKEYASRLSAKYHKKMDDVTARIEEELNKYQDKVLAWRNTEEANYHPSKIDVNTGEKKYSKSKNEQLSDPIEITSSTQLAILLYDVLKIPSVDKDTPRGTGEDILKQIDIPLSSLILEQRGIAKLINTYIDKLPECVNEKDDRLHASFKQLGTDTGRFSSSNPNLQNIPSHEKSIRMLFKAGYTDKLIDEIDNTFEVYKSDEVLTEDGWKKSTEVSIEDKLVCENNKSFIVMNIVGKDETIIFIVKEDFVI